jgi:hypothetical protein
LLQIKSDAQVCFLLRKRTTEFGDAISSMKSTVVKNMCVFFGVSFNTTAAKALQAFFRLSRYSALRNPEKMQLRRFKTEYGYK